jgi:hypothetical protein
MFEVCEFHGKGRLWLAGCAEEEESAPPRESQERVDVLGCIRFCGLLGVHPVHPRTEDRPARIKVWHPGWFGTWPRETPADIVILFKTFIQDTHETHRPGQGAL